MEIHYSRNIAEKEKLMSPQVTPYSFVHCRGIRKYCESNTVIAFFYINNQILLLVHSSTFCSLPCVPV